MIAASRLRLTKSQRRSLMTALPFVGPWIIGFIAFTAYPIFYSFRISFTQSSGLGEPIPTGLDNYKHMMSDPLFWKSLYNTLYYVGWAVPVGLVVAIVLALLMNQKVREVAIYRAAFYLPSILPVYALTFIFIVLLNPRFGFLNYALSLVGVPTINWLGDPAWTKIAVVILAQLGAGGPALIFLASLRGMPKDLYESAEIDGASTLRRFAHITLPLLTPVILYDIILGLILGLQIFTPAYVLTQGGAGAGAGQYVAGPDNSLLFYVLYLYKTAFQFTDFGYASALATVLFGVSVVLALAIMRTSRGWVYYEGEAR